MKSNALLKSCQALAVTAVFFSLQPVLHAVVEPKDDAFETNLSDPGLVSGKNKKSTEPSARRSKKGAAVCTFLGRCELGFKPGLPYLSVFPLPYKIKVSGSTKTLIKPNYRHWAFLKKARAAYYKKNPSQKIKKRFGRTSLPIFDPQNVPNYLGMMTLDQIKAEQKRVDALHTTLLGAQEPACLKKSASPHDQKLLATAHKMAILKQQIRLLARAEIQKLQEAQVEKARVEKEQVEKQNLEKFNQDYPRSEHKPTKTAEAEDVLKGSAKETPQQPAQRRSLEEGDSPITTSPLIVRSSDGIPSIR